MTKQTIDSEIYDRLKTISELKWDTVSKLKEYLDTVKPKKSRTLSQNSALHLFFTQLSDALNDAGLPMNEMLTVNIDWTPDNVKKHLWAVFQKKIYHTDSTTQLDKHEQITKIHETLMRELGEKKGIEYIPFPSEEKKEVSAIEDMHSSVEYPKSDLKEDKF